MQHLDTIAQSLIRGETDALVAAVQAALTDGVAPGAILNEGLIAAMHVVGEKFRTREFFLPDVLLASKAMTAATEVLKPLLLGTAVPIAGKVVLGTMRGDVHDIGKNLVAMMLRGAGFEVIDLGKDVSPERFVQAAIDQRAQVVGMSALLTTTMTAMKEVVDRLVDAGIRDKTKVIVGGAPVTQAFADEIGADAYGYDAGHAVQRVRALVEGS